MLFRSSLGIGNDDPIYPLDVRSTGVAVYGNTTGGAGTAGVYGRGETTGYGVMGTSTSGRGVYGASTSGFGGYFLGPTSYISGNLGIGTETPTHKLTVNGSAAIQSSGTTKYHVGYYHGGLDFSETTVADYRLMLKDGGNVGIGTGSPTAKLHVMGNVKVRDTLTAGAIFATSLADEPGVASNHGANYVQVTVSGGFTNVQDIRSRSITTPGPGYVLAIGVATAWMDHTYGDLDCLWVGLSDSSSTCTQATHQSFCEGTLDGSEAFYTPITVCNIYHVEEAGPHVFYLVAARSGFAECTLYYPQLYLLYIPTAYGTVAPSTYVSSAADGATPEEALRAPRESSIDAAQTPSMADVLKELVSLRQKVEALEKERQ